MTSDTLRSLLETAVSSLPRSHVFFRYYAAKEWKTQTYAETLDRVRVLAEWFGAQGLQPRRTHVAILLPNGPEWLECFLAVTWLAGVVIPIDPKLTAPELHHILSDSEAELLVTDAAHLPLIREVLPTLTGLRHILLAAPGDTPLPLPITTLQEAFASIPNDRPQRFRDDPDYRPRPDDLCSILYTSGTTGKPKGAMLTHRNFVADTRGALTLICDYVTPQDDFYVVLPLFHAFSFTANFLVALASRASLTFMRSLRTVTEDLKTLRPTVLMTVPLMAEKIHARLMEKVFAGTWSRLVYRLTPKVIGKHLLAAMGGRLRLIIVGGAKADTAILSSFNRMGIPMAEGYGLTECAPVVSVCPPRRIRIGTIGPAIGGIEVKIDSPDKNGIGELLVRGPITFRGYWKNPEATEEVYAGDWFKTGDLASIDSKGFIAIRGRAKSLIVNREGKNIYPEEVEQAIAREPLVGAAVVIPWQTKGEPGEKVGALISINTDLAARLFPGATPEELEARVRQAVKTQCAALAAYKHPRKVVISPTPLTLTSTQKVRRCLYAGALDD